MKNAASVKWLGELKCGDRVVVKRHEGYYLPSFFERYDSGTFWTRHGGFTMRGEGGGGRLVKYNASRHKHLYDRLLLAQRLLDFSGPPINEVQIHEAGRIIWNK